MKWKTSLTAEEATLLALKATGFSSIQAIADACEAEQGKKQEALEQLLMDAQQLNEALLIEVALADPYDSDFYPENPRTAIELALRAEDPDFNYIFDAPACLIKRDSLANWFWFHDPDIARLFDPRVEDRFAPSITEKVGQKKLNSLLGLLEVLATGLVGDLTGKPKKDAEIIEQGLMSARLECPVTTKTLAKYLDEVPGEVKKIL